MKIAGKPQNNAASPKSSTTTSRNIRTAKVTSKAKAKSVPGSSVSNNGSLKKNKTPAAITMSTIATVRERALVALSNAMDETGSGKVVVAFNHYRKQFPIYNSVLQWKDVDAEYAFSYVYKGEYSRNLIHIREPDRLGREISASGDMGDSSSLERCENSEYFIGLKPGGFYQAVVEEGEDGIGADGLRLREGPLNYSKEAQPRAGNIAVKHITDELLAMNVSDLHSEEAKRLKEARDIEDVLYS